MGNIGVWQLLIIAVIVVLLFGTKKLKNIGSDLGGAIKGFKSSMKDDPKEEEADFKNIEEKATKTIETEETITKKDQV